LQGLISSCAVHQTHHSTTSTCCELSHIGLHLLLLLLLLLLPTTRKKQ
jgi:hypothetical protein